MKNMKFLTAVILAFASLAVSCSDDDNDNAQKPVAVTGVALSSSSLSLVIGTDSTLVATVLPEDAADMTITWASSDETIATVADGKVSALAIGGPVTVIVTTGDGGFTATCAVTVVEPPEKVILPEEVTVTTVCGTSHLGSVNGTLSEASFFGLTCLTMSTSGIIYVGDWMNFRIQKIVVTGNQVSTLAGPPPASSPFVGAPSGYVNATGPDARFSNITDVDMDAAGNIYVVDLDNCAIRKITPAGEVTTFAGADPQEAGYVDGSGTEARFNNPYGVFVAATGDFYVTDLDNYRIRKITPAGVVSTLAGDGIEGFVDGTAATARFLKPRGITMDQDGNLYVADLHAVRKITPDGVVSTLAGSRTAGYLDGPGVEAQFSDIYGLTVDAEGYLYVTDSGNNRVRMITPSGVVTTLAGTGDRGTNNGTGVTATFFGPRGITMDASGNIFLTDVSGNTVRKITFNQ
jgi:sugar lactone lactonase YvrE